MKVKFQNTGVVISIHDGDSITIKLDIPTYLNTSTTIIEEMRLAHFDAPELKKVGGMEALRYLQTLIQPGDTVIVATYGREKWKRPLVDVWKLGVEKSLSEQMLRAGHGVKMGIEMQIQHV